MISFCIAKITVEYKLQLGLYGQNLGLYGHLRP